MMLLWGMDSGWMTYLDTLYELDDWTEELLLRWMAAEEGVGD